MQTYLFAVFFFSLVFENVRPVGVNIRITFPKPYSSTFTSELIHYRLDPARM
jgi:hypothetical protein